MLFDRGALSQRNQSANRFVWPNWIVKGHFNLLSSDPKVGKTHLMLDISKRVHFGLAWPDGRWFAMWS